MKGEREEVDVEGLHVDAGGRDELGGVDEQQGSLLPRGLPVPATPTIAERLYVTERTVETHLTRVFDKLNITSRTALAGALALPETPVDEPV